VSIGFFRSNKTFQWRKLVFFSSRRMSRSSDEKFGSDRVDSCQMGDLQKKIYVKGF
jgi:hypothetical protein